MKITFKKDGSVDKIQIDEFVNQLSSGQKIGIVVIGLSADEFTARAYGVLPNGEATVITCVPVEGTTYWEITLNTANTAYAGKLAVTVQIVLNESNFVFTYPLYLTINPTIPGSTKFPITLDEVTTFLSQLQNYPTKSQADARFQQKFSLNTMRVYSSLEDLTTDWANLKVGQLCAVRTDEKIGLFYKNQAGSTIDCYISLSESSYKDGEGNIIHEYYATKESVENLQAYLEGGTIIVKEARYAGYDTLTGEQLATKPYVDEKIGTMSSHYLTSDALGNSFSTKEALLAGPYYYGIDLHTPDQNDYAFVNNDETHGGEAARYVYQNEQWSFQYVIPTPVAGVNDVKVDGVSVVNTQKVANISLVNKQDKIIVESDEDITIGGLSVPKLTVEQVETIYNHLISGNSVVVSSDDGVKHFSPIIADYLDEAAIHFLYYNLLITYYIENDTVKNEYIDLENVVHKTGNEEISGVKTFTNGLQLKGSSKIDGGNGYYIGFYADGVSYALANSGFTSIDNRDLGTSSYKWEDLYLSGLAYIGTGNIEATSSAFAIRNNGTNTIVCFTDAIRFYLPIASEYNQDCGTTAKPFKDVNITGEIKVKDSVAQYKKTRLLSESEYEALTDEEKNNGVIYDIYED